MSIIKYGFQSEIIAMVEQHEIEINEIQQVIGAYGLKWNETDDVLTRMGQATDTTDFNQVFPWSNIRRCNVADNGTVLAYYGDPTFVEDGTNGQVMVEYPKTYTKYLYYTLAGKVYHEWWVSGTQHMGFEVDQSFVYGDTIKERFYLGTYEGSIYDVTTPQIEINTLTVTAPATTSGNITITLDGYQIFTVAVLNTDNTTDLVATKIRSASYTGWTTGGTGSDVIFTSTSNGARTTATFSGGTTGVTATIAKTQTGAGGYIQYDAQVADFTVSTGDKLCSISGVKPCSGLTQDLTIVKSRILANNRGTGWGLWNATQVAFVQQLFMIEYASFNTQTKIGLGVVNKVDDGLTNMANNTGATSFLGNLSGRQSGTDGLTSVSYRGVENIWGNIWGFVDGINIQADNKLWINTTNKNMVSDSYVPPYYLQGTLANTNGYVSKLLGTKYGLFPTQATGSSTTRVPDYYYQATGNRVALLGSAWDRGADAGFACWSLSDSSASRSRRVGARLCYQN